MFLMYVCVFCLSKQMTGQLTNTLKPYHPQQRASSLIVPPILADSKPLGKEVFLILMLLVEASCYEPQCVTSGLPNHCFVRHFILMRIVHKNTHTLTQEQRGPYRLVARVSFLLLPNQHRLVGIRLVKNGAWRYPS